MSIFRPLRETKSTVKSNRQVVKILHRTALKIFPYFNFRCVSVSISIHCHPFDIRKKRESSASWNVGNSSNCEVTMSISSGADSGESGDSHHQGTLKWNSTTRMRMNDFAIKFLFFHPQPCLVIFSPAPTFMLVQLVLAVARNVFMASSLILD